jgi:hypothetical protein
MPGAGGPGQGIGDPVFEGGVSMPKSCVESSRASNTVKHEGVKKELLGWSMQLLEESKVRQVTISEPPSDRRLPCVGDN